MPVNDLTASEIEVRPADEANYQLSQRIYDSAAKTPDQFQTVVQQLDQDSKSGAVSGVSIDYDNQGKVAAITINNENLYNSSDATIPGQLAGNQIGAEIASGDMNAALNESLTMATTFGLTDAAAVRQAVLTGLGSDLGDKLKEADLTDAGQYLAQLEQSSGSDAADLLTVLQTGKDQSGLGDRAAIETDSQTGAVTAFKVDGQDLLKPRLQATDAPVPSTQADTDVPPVDLFTPDRSDIPAYQGPDQTPPADPAPAVDNTTSTAGADTTKVAQRPVSDTQAGALPPNGDTAAGGQQPNADSTTVVQQPTADTTSIVQQPSKDATTTTQQLGTDATINAQQPVADVTALAPLTEQDKADRDLFQKAVARVIDFRNESLPVQRGEGYYQVVSRMHDNWSDDDIMEETHRLKAINNFSDELRVGQRLSLISDEEKAELVKVQLDAFDKANPGERAQMIAQAENHAQSCESADSAGKGRDTAMANQDSGTAGQNSDLSSQVPAASSVSPEVTTEVYRSKGNF